MSQEFSLRTFSREEIREIEEQEAKRVTVVSPVEQVIVDRNAKWEVLRKKYPLPEGASVHTVENMGLIAYAELAINAYGFDPITNPEYRPDLDPLPTAPQRAAILGRGENSIPTINL